MMYYQDGHTRIYNGDAREMSKKIIEPGSIDLIFTDPPYPAEFHYLYQWLAREAKRVLKPTGFLFTYVAPYWKQRVMTTLGRHLDYYFDFILLHNGNTTILWPRRIIGGYKSIIAYTQKGEKPLPVTNVLGKFSGAGSDKRFHKWGQSEIEARYYIDCFSREDDTVVDYFLGGGTTSEVCKRLNRRFIGFEIDREVFKVARARVEGGLGPQEKGRQCELLPAPASRY